MIRAVFFDLDGTLLPMDQKVFVEGYMRGICAAVVPEGLEAELMTKALWRGVRAMVVNDGTVPNADRFWATFEHLTGKRREQFEPVCDRFYETAFHDAKAFTGSNPLAVRAVANAKRNGRVAVLATNPLFPPQGQRSRMSWVGLKPEDFALVTDYKSDRWCKPDPRYYLSICERLGLKPEEVLMIGNDER